MFEFVDDAFELTIIYVRGYLICGMSRDMIWRLAFEEVLFERFQSFADIVTITLSYFEIWMEDFWWYIVLLVLVPGYQREDTHKNSNG